MILADIRNYLEQRGSACLSDIALHLNAPPDAVRGMLAVWIRKDRIRKLPADPACGSSCGGCQPAQVERYQWIEGVD